MAWFERGVDSTYGQTELWRYGARIFLAWATFLPALGNVVAIASGYQHILALKSDGTAVGWGTGDGAAVPPGLSNVVQIASGDSHALALRSDGAVVAWGTTVSVYFAAFAPFTRSLIA